MKLFMPDLRIGCYKPLVGRIESVANAGTPFYGVVPVVHVLATETRAQTKGLSH